ncbi:MAG: lamin tail domain-containing protein [Opitutaceae bacterium]|nr:lamin tail domain-containing protein [Opitutaceae bacterium]
MSLRVHMPFARPLQLAAALFVGTASAAPTSSPTLPASGTPALRINEVLAWNTRLAHAGTFPDFIELHNAGTTAIDLGGKSLTDDPLLPRKFVFPAGTSIPAGGYLVIFAELATTAPGLHTGFALDAEGDQVRLLDSQANGGTLLDSIEFGFQIPDFSISRTGADAGTWALTVPTSSAANASPVPLGPIAAVRLNEWAGKITFRLDHDMIELFNPTAQPAAIGGVRLTDDLARPTRFVFPKLSFIGGAGFLPLYGADFVFGLDGDFEVVSLLGENNEQIDQVTISQQANDKSGGRSPDGGATLATYDVPTPGLPNDTPLPPAYRRLLDKLRITEIMYQPALSGGSSDHEFIELHNTGETALDLSGVRFTNGLVYTFPPGTTLAGGAYIVVADKRTHFLARYPGAAAALAPGEFNGALDNSGETIALTLPAPWRVHILRFRYEPTWYPTASGAGHSLVLNSVETTSAKDWAARSSWRASTAVHGSPGAADPPPAMTGAGSRLSNLSVRTSLAAGQTMIVGVVVSGGWRNVLVRAAGPALAAFGLTSAMTDPRLELYNGNTRILENDDWPATLAATAAGVGAFAFTPGSRDAGFVEGMEGPRSIQVRGTGAGIVLVEAYDTGTGNSPRLINLSARNQVGTGDDILIAGFSLAGSGMKQLVIRAVGPKLAAFGVPGTLADPKLELYSSTGAKIAENDNWTSTLAGAFSMVGAFPLDAGSRDAALITTLATGSYTVQVKGADGGTGEALVEIYELP